MPISAETLPSGRQLHTVTLDDLSIHYLLVPVSELAPGLTIQAMARLERDPSTGEARRSDPPDPAIELTAEHIADYPVDAHVRIREVLPDEIETLRVNG